MWWILPVYHCLGFGCKIKRKKERDVVAGRQCSVTARGKLAVPQCFVEVGTHRSGTYSPWDISSKRRRCSEKLTRTVHKETFHHGIPAGTMAGSIRPWERKYRWERKAKPNYFYMTGGAIPPKFTHSTLPIWNFDRTKTRIEKCDNIFLMMSTLLAPLQAKQQYIIRRILSCLSPSCITSSINISEKKSVHTHIDQAEYFTEAAFMNL